MAARFQTMSFDESVRKRIKDRLAREMAERAKKKRKHAPTNPDSAEDPPAKRARTMEPGPMPLATSSNTYIRQSTTQTSSRGRKRPGLVPRSTPIPAKRAVPKYLSDDSDFVDKDFMGTTHPDSSRDQYPSLTSTPLFSDDGLSGSDKENIPPFRSKSSKNGRASNVPPVPGHVSPDLFDDELISINDRFNRTHMVTNVHGGSRQQIAKLVREKPVQHHKTQSSSSSNLPHPYPTNVEPVTNRSSTPVNHGHIRDEFHSDPDQNDKNGMNQEGAGDVSVQTHTSGTKKRKLTNDMHRVTKRPCMDLSLFSDEEMGGDMASQSAGPKYLRTQFSYIDTEASATVKIRAAQDLLQGVTEESKILRLKGLLPPLPDGKVPTVEELKIITNSVLDSIITAAEANGQRHLEKVPSIDTVKKVMEQIKLSYSLSDTLCAIMARQINGRRNYIVRRIKQGETAESKKIDRRRKQFVSVMDSVHIRAIVPGDTRYDAAFQRSDAVHTEMDKDGLWQPIGPCNDLSLESISSLCKHFKRRLTNVSFSHVDVHILCQEYGHMNSYIRNTDTTDIVTNNILPMLGNEKLYDMYLSILLGTKLSIGVKQLALMRLELFSNSLTRLFQSSATRVRTIIDNYREAVQYHVPTPIMLVLLTIDYFEENKTCITHAENDVNGNNKNSAQITSGSPLTLVANHTEEGDPTSYDIFISGVNIATHTDEMDAVYHFLSAFYVFNIDETTFESVDEVTIDPGRGKATVGSGIPLSLHFLARIILGADNAITKKMSSKRKSYQSLEARFQKEFFYAFHRQHHAVKPT